MKQNYICKYVELYCDGTWGCLPRREMREMNEEYKGRTIFVGDAIIRPICPSDVKKGIEFDEVICFELENCNK